MGLADRKCEACEGGIPKLTPVEISTHMKEVPGWTLEENQLRRTYIFENFVAAMMFLNKVADIAEAEGHHPDFRVYSWNRVDFTIWTHAIGGLSINDFILAAKIEKLSKELKK